MRAARFAGALGSDLQLLAMGFAVSVTSCTAESVEQSPEKQELPTNAVANPIIGGCCGVGGADPATQGLRLSVNSDSAAADGAGVDLYLVPHGSSAIALYDGSQWVLRTVVATPQISGTGVPDEKRAIYAYWDGSDVLLESLPVSTLATQDGVEVLASDSTRRFIGLISYDGNGQFRDMPNERLVWNRYSQIYRSIRGFYDAGWYLSGSQGWREVDNNSASRVKVLAGPLSSAGNTYISAHALGACRATSSGGGGWLFLWNRYWN